ncbi:hypothetical protein FRC04_001253 [Tulasnella sp. 424]|nr:hypothetical protein FRC04_001253 [Tulasnella sp. 424]
MSTFASLTTLEPARLERRASSSSSIRPKSIASSHHAQPITPQDATPALGPKKKSSSRSLRLIGRDAAPSIRAREHHEVDGETIQLEDMAPSMSKEGLSASASTAGIEGQQAPAPEFDMSIRDERIYLATLCYNLFVAGWNDATLGPLLPRIQEYYHVGYTVVSILFVVGCVGVITGALSNVYLSERLGFGKAITLAAALQILTYAAMSTAPPFPVLCIALFVNGWALSLQDAGSNAFIASIPRNERNNMGILHAMYGVGAFVSPFVATHFAQQKHWSFHFLCSLGVALLNVILLLYVFRLKPQSHFISEAGHPEESSSENRYKQIFQQKSVHLMSFFILVYVGVEVTIGGWIFTYLLNERHGGPSAGYVSSGFFGGLTLGRIILLPINDKIGHERVIHLYSLLTIALEFTIWFVPSLIGNAVAVSFVGLLLGPFYPIAMNVISGLLPRWLLAGSIGWIAAFGQAGAAVFPFMTGALASKYGVQVLQPLLVAMMAAQMVLWFFVTHSKLSRAD